MGVTYVPSHANFLLVHVGEAAAAYESLLRQGVIVRPVANYGLPEHLRVSVGLADRERTLSRCTASRAGTLTRLLMQPLAKLIVVGVGLIGGSFALALETPARFAVSSASAGATPISTAAQQLGITDRTYTTGRKRWHAELRDAESGPARRAGRANAGTVRDDRSAPGRRDDRHRCRQHQAGRHRGSARASRCGVAALRAGSPDRGDRTFGRGGRVCLAVPRQERDPDPDRRNQIADAMARVGDCWTRCGGVVEPTRCRASRRTVRGRQPFAARAGICAGGRARGAARCRRILSLRRGRLSRLHAAREQPSRDVARHLHRQSRGTAHRACVVPGRAGPDRSHARGGRRRRTGNNVCRCAQRAQCVARGARRQQGRSDRRWNSSTCRRSRMSPARCACQVPRAFPTGCCSLAALAAGTTELDGLLESDDTQVMLDALKALGIALAQRCGALDTVVPGCGGPFPNKHADLFLGLSGLSMRTLTAALAFSSGNYRARWCCAHARAADRRPGRRLAAVGRRHSLRTGRGLSATAGRRRATPTTTARARIRGDVSSQFLTGLLQALPLLPAGATVDVDGELISKPYIEITLNLMRRFGVEVERDGWQQFRVPAGAQLPQPGTHSASKATRPPRRIFSRRAPSVADPSGSKASGAPACRATSLLPTRWRPWAPRFAAATTGSRRAPDGPSRHRLRLQHDPGRGDDRGDRRPVRGRADDTAQHRQLAGQGDRSHRGDGHRTAQARRGRRRGRGLAARDAAGDAPSATIDTYDDHRMAMCFSLAALGGVPVRINDPQCVRKTFPDYFAELRRLAK